MKNYLVAAMVLLALVGCSKKQTTANNTANPNALAEYRARGESFSNAMQDFDLTDEEYEEVFEGFISFADSIFTASPSDSLATAILEDLVWYLDVDFRERLYNAVDVATMDEHMFRYYKAFQAEKQTTIGCHYADIAALTPNGEELKLSDVVGLKPYVLVDFWATWCGPCRASLPGWKQLCSVYGEKFEIVGVSLDNDHDKWADFIEKNDLVWLHMSDLKGWEAAPASVYGVCSIPATVLIDVDGVIVARNIEPEELAELLADLD